MSGPLGIRATPEEYRAWTEAAALLHVSRNRWMRNTLNEESDRLLAEADDAAMRQAQQLRVEQLAAKSSYEPDFK